MRLTLWGEISATKGDRAACVIDRPVFLSINPFENAAAESATILNFCQEWFSPTFDIGAAMSIYATPQQLASTHSAVRINR